MDVSDSSYCISNEKKKNKGSQMMNTKIKIFKRVREKVRERVKGGERERE
jgi:hypothetical protein